MPCELLATGSQLAAMPCEFLAIGNQLAAMPCELLAIGSQLALVLFEFDVVEIGFALLLPFCVVVELGFAPVPALTQNAFVLMPHIYQLQIKEMLSKQIETYQLLPLVQFAELIASQKYFSQSEEPK